MKICLFLCSGNYYRSRFAEEFFNHHAARRGLAWRAESRGLVPDISTLRNPGPMSHHALDALRQRNVAPRAAARPPASVTPEDWSRAALIVALYEPEHRPMVLRQHPEWLSRVEFWQIGDVGDAAPAEAMAALARGVLDLLRRLGAAPAAA